MIAVLIITFGVAFTGPALADSTPLTSFNQYLINDEGSRVPPISFYYSIEPGSAVAATETTQAILAGIGAPDIMWAAFSDGEEA